MVKPRKSQKPANPSLPKAPTGIQGLDEITGGGLPRGRPTLVCGSTGCGKTLLAMEFLVRGATEFGEPGVFIAFEETSEELARNVRSLGFDLRELAARKKILVDYVHVERSEIEETGEYDLGGLFIRLDHAINSIGAKRVVLDTIETLFGGLSHPGILRSELRRLFRWLKDKGVTAVITGERGDGTLTRNGLEEYVSDCVILLDHRVTEQLSTRRLRIVKYRGTTHGTNEFPFLIEEDGISVLPVTSLGLNQEASGERISTGIAKLDAMLGGDGVYRASTVLVSGTAGSGKTSLAAHFADAACRRGEHCLFFTFEESEGQLIRNMRSIGLDLAPWLKKGLLRVHASRPSAYGLEMHLAKLHKLVGEFRPHVVVVDPITTFLGAGTSPDAKSMLLRLVDFLKSGGMTAVFTSLAHGGDDVEESQVGISSMIDTWLMVRNLEYGGERNRGLYILKSRGMAHSNQIREFLLTSRGIELRDVSVGLDGVLTGSMRAAHEAQERSALLQSRQETKRRQRAVERKRQAMEKRITALREQFEFEKQELALFMAQDESTAGISPQQHEQIARSGQADLAAGSNRKRTTRGERQ